MENDQLTAKVTLLLDKKREIGTPVRCAEVVAGTLPGNFGMRKEAEWLVNETHFFKLISSKGREIKIKTTPYTGYVLERTEFERELAEMALEEGAHLKLGITATGINPEGVIAGGELIKAKIIIPLS